MILFVAASNVRPGDILIDDETGEQDFTVRRVRPDYLDPHYVHIYGGVDVQHRRVWKTRAVEVEREVQR